MQFFTTDLYRRFNSADDEIADQADQEWEDAIHAYRKHFKAIEPQLDAQTRSLAKLELHDAERLAWKLGSDPVGPAAPPVAFLYLEQVTNLIALNYFLRDAVRESAPPADWPVSQQQTHWLYDELDLEDGGPVHRILFSDGSTSEIPFTTVIVNVVSLDKAGSRQSA